MDDPKSSPAPEVRPEAGPIPAKKPGQAPELGGPEFGGPEGPEPTRYGDWERNGRCVDF